MHLGKIGAVALHTLRGLVVVWQAALIDNGSPERRHRRNVTLHLVLTRWKMEPVEGRPPPAPATTPELDAIWDGLRPTSPALAAPYVGAYYDPKADRYRCVTFLRHMQLQTTPALFVLGALLKGALRDGSTDHDQVLAHAATFARNESHSNVLGTMFVAPQPFVDQVGALKALMTSGWPHVTWVLVYENGQKHFGLASAEEHAWAGTDAYPAIELVGALCEMTTRAPFLLGVSNDWDMHAGWSANNARVMECIDCVREARATLQQQADDRAAAIARALARVGVGVDADADDGAARGMDLADAVDEGNGKEEASE